MKPNRTPSSRARATPAEDWVEAVLHEGGPATHIAPDPQHRAGQIRAFDTSRSKVVVLGGGTGLSTVVGGNAMRPDWSRRPSIGLKEIFPRLTVVVCTTDDGGSTGEILKQLPMIGIGDLRKSCLSLMRAEQLQRAYALDPAQTHDVLLAIQQIFNHRFPPTLRGTRELAQPARVLTPPLRRALPATLTRAFTALGTYARHTLRLDPRSHCLGNLLITAAIFKAANGHTDRAPPMPAIIAGLHHIAGLLAVPPHTLFPATATPGQLTLRYANGVEVLGQTKSSSARRNTPVDRLAIEFSARPVVHPRVIKALRDADLIVIAPGSLYTSILPVLQLPPVADAIRANRRAVKVLGANFWIQQGETDVSQYRQGREYRVSELIEAYDRNIPGGAQGIIDIILSANLQHMPGHILRNYELEGKRPIHLDRSRVVAMGFTTIEATLFSPHLVNRGGVIHHDPEKFALALRAILCHRAHHPAAAGPQPRSAVPPAAPPPARRRPPPCHYMAALRAALDDKTFRPARLKSIMLEIAWQNRDIQPAHFAYFRGAAITPAKAWRRSTEWDNVLGFYEPADGKLHLHEDLIDRPERLREDLLIALGESLLGRYIARRALRDDTAHGVAVRYYEIHLRPPAERACYLRPEQLHTYLTLAGMNQDAHDPRCYRRMINGKEGFLPPGLLFGLMYAWYLNNDYGVMMEYEMSLLRWPRRSLLPHQAREQQNKQALVDFFREQVFGYPPAPEARR